MDSLDLKILFIAVVYGLGLIWAWLFTNPDFVVTLVLEWIALQTFFTLLLLRYVGEIKAKIDKCSKPAHTDSKQLIKRILRMLDEDEEKDSSVF